MPKLRAQTVRLIREVLLERLGVKPQDVRFPDGFLESQGTLLQHIIEKAEWAGETVCVADLLPGGDYEEVGIAVCESYRNWGRGRYESPLAAETPRRFPANEKPRECTALELYHYLPERVQQELRQHMETVLALWSENWQPPFDSAESTLQAMEQCYASIEQMCECWGSAILPYPFALAWWKDVSDVLQVRFDNNVHSIPTEYLSEPLDVADEASSLAVSACLNRADAAAFLLYGRKPEYPSFVAVLGPFTLTVHLPAWLSHPAVQAIWQAVHVNLHQQVATLCVTRWRMIPPPTATRLFHWWNQHAPAEWHYGTPNALANALRRAEGKIRVGKEWDFVPDGAEPPVPE